MSKLYVQSFPELLKFSGSLAAGASISGSLPCAGYSQLVGYITSSGSPETGSGLCVQQSVNGGSTWDINSGSYASAVAFTSSCMIDIIGNAVNVRFAAGATNLTAVRLLFQLKPVAGTAKMTNVTVDGVTSGSMFSRSNALMGNSVVYRTSVSANDLVPNAASPNLTNVGSGTGTLGASIAYYVAIAPANAWGVNVSSASSVTTPTGPSSHSIRVAGSQIVGASNWHVFCGTTACPAYLGSITTDRIDAGGWYFSAPYTLASGGTATACTFDIQASGGTGPNSTSSPFTINTALNPLSSSVPIINGSGFSNIWLYTSIQNADMRTMPTATLVPFFYENSASSWYQGTAQALTLLTAVNWTRKQALVINHNGVDTKILIQGLGGQGASVNMYYSLV